MGGIARALQHRDFRVYSIGASASFVGTWVYRAGLGWFTWELTASTTWLGIVVFVEVLPHVLLVPITGALTDRIGALFIAKLSQICATTVMTVLAVLTAFDVMTIEILLVFVFLNGLIMSMNQPSFFGMLALLVPRHDFSAAIALQSATVQTARFIGPAVAGGLMVWQGAALAFAFNAASYIGLLVALFMVRRRDAPRETVQTSLLSDIVEGLRFVGGHFAIRTILLITVMLSILLRPVMELMPGFASQVFGRGADGLAWLMSAAGVGAIFGSLWIARRGRTTGLTRIFAASTVIGAVALLGFAQTGAFAAGVVLIALWGLTTNINSTCSQILVQNSVDPAMRARVMSLVGLTFRAVPAMSAAVVGWLASIYGLALPISAAAVLGLVIGFWMFRLIRRANLAHLAEEAPPRGAPDRG